MKWEIINKGKAKELHLSECNGLLSIDITKIPNGMSMEEYINYIQENNIALHS